MKRIFSLGFALALLSGAAGACTMNFDQFQAAGGAAGAGGAGGACPTECCAPTDCPAPADPCQQATCSAGACGEEARPDGADAGMQTAGDCKKMVCQGGVPEAQDDNTDTPDDGNDCTTDTCAGGMPASEPAAAGTACMSDGGKVCNDQADCVECVMDGDCPMGKPNCDPGSFTCVDASCLDGELNGNETDVDCGGGSCPGCPVGDNCKLGSDCASGVCGVNGKCSAPTCSDTVLNGSETDVDCGGSCPDCGPGKMCDGDNDCEGDDCTGGICVPNCDDKVKNNDETDVDCGGSCSGCAVGGTCMGNGDCALGNCVGGTCAKLPLGASCAAGANCMSNFCADGVCCNAGCGGTCVKCNLAGTVGTCTNIPSGQDPDNECVGMQVCNGNGQCRKVAGQTCAGNGECLSSFCADGVCCDSACAGLCQACNVAGSIGTCSNVPNNTDPANECTGATSCDGAGACNKLPNGTACTMAAECSSALCVDGVCCDAACGGTCVACNVAGSVGTCTNVPAGTDPANECNGAMTPNCNGMGACGP